MDEFKSGMMKRHRDMFGVRHSYPKDLCREYDVNSCEDVVWNGRVVKKSVARLVRPQDRFKGLSAYDFALENVIAAGALGSLREGYYGCSTLEGLSDAMEPVMDSLVSAVDAAVSANNNEVNSEV